MLFDFWHQLPDGDFVHPADKDFLAQKPGLFQLGMPPGHINGSLRNAPVVVCYLNPGYENDDAVMSQSESDKKVLRQQMSGESAFPLQFEGWKKWYMARVGRVALPIESLAKTVAIFNVCAYASKDAKKLSRTFLKKLPSSQIARRYLHEVVIPQAKRGERFLVIGRGAWAWEVDRTIVCDNIRFAPNPVGGHFGEEIGTAVNRWLRSKDVIAAPSNYPDKAREGPDRRELLKTQLAHGFF